jgi:VanZ family protein
MPKNRYTKLLFTFITIGFVLFIFSNSLFTGPESGKKSQFAMELINHFISLLGGAFSVSEHMVRKAAHFTEYFVFGNLLAVTVRMYAEKPVKHIFMALFCLLSVPVADEFLQTFVQGRSGNVNDIILDFTGGFVGLMLCILIIRLHQSQKVLPEKPFD